MLDRCARIFTGNMPLMRRKSGAADDILSSAIEFAIRRFIYSAVILADPVFYNGEGLARSYIFTGGTYG